MPSEEYVVLVDEADRVLGEAPKRSVHHGETPLHRGFSLFLFDREGRTLLQRRAATKATWPGVWSNGCCGHPALGESPLDAARRRAADELGVAVDDLWVVLPGYRYRAELAGVVENELCPVMVGRLAAPPRPNAAEVGAIEWRPWGEFLAALEREPSPYSPWCREEARLLERRPEFRAWRTGAR